MTADERIIEMCWKDEIISIMSKKIGHEMSLSDIYNEIKHTQLVTDYHLKPWKPGGQPRYQCWVRRGLTDLVNEGKIKRLRRGVYILHLPSK